MKGKKMIYLEIEKEGENYIFYDQAGNTYKWIGREITPIEKQNLNWAISTKKVARVVVDEISGELERIGTASYKFFDRGSDKDAENCKYLEYFDIDDNPVINTEIKNNSSIETQVAAQ